MDDQKPHYSGSLGSVFAATASALAGSLTSIAIE